MRQMVAAGLLSLLTAQSPSQIYAQQPVPPLAASATQQSRIIDGNVLILEYHQFGNHEERWMRSATHFREDLHKLYAQGFRAVNLVDYLRDKNNDALRLNAGEKPVILTFDDASEMQFKLLRAPRSTSLDDVMAAADPDCAARMLYDFHKEHPDWRMAGTFYVSFPPFKNKEWPLLVRTLADAGFEIGNHTLSHDNLSNMPAQQVTREIVGAIKELRKAIPDYSPRTLALPFGISPKNAEGKAALISGTLDGISYHHDGVLLVGSGPVPPKGSQRFDASRLPRLQVITVDYDKGLHFDAALSRAQRGYLTVK